MATNFAGGARGHRSTIYHYLHFGPAGVQGHPHLQAGAESLVKVVQC